jgi:hypothetical protein
MVEVHGTVDGSSFSVGLYSNGADIFKGFTHLAAAQGALLEYKFAINRGGTLTYEGNVGSGTSGSRSLLLQTFNVTTGVFQ